jgi:predicted DNA-binding WGR domain protein
MERHDPSMADTLSLILERRDPARNMARFYVLSIQPTLFGDVAVQRAWGRIGRLGRERLDLYRSEVHAVEALEQWLARKLRKGYALRSSSPALALGSECDAAANSRLS